MCAPTTGLNRRGRIAGAWPNRAGKAYPSRRRRLNKAVKRFVGCMMGLLVSESARAT